MASILTALSEYAVAELGQQAVRVNGTLVRPGVHVEHGEVVGQDRDRESKQDRAGDGADGADHVAEARHRRHVAVADRGDRYQTPPARHPTSAEILTAKRLDGVKPKFHDVGSLRVASSRRPR